MAIGRCLSLFVAQTACVSHIAPLGDLAPHPLLQPLLRRGAGEGPHHVHVPAFCIAIQVRRCPGMGFLVFVSI